MLNIGARGLHTQSNMDMPVGCKMQFTNATKCFSPKLAFHADNGTAEIAAAARYSGKVWVIKAVQTKYELRQARTPEESTPAVICVLIGNTLHDIVSRPVHLPICSYYLAADPSLGFTARAEAGVGDGGTQEHRGVQCRVLL